MTEARPSEHGRERALRQEADTVRARSVIILLVLGVLVIAGGIAWAWWLLDGELAHSRPGLGLRYGPFPEARPAAPRRLRGLLQGPIDGRLENDETAPAAPAEDLETWGWADPEHRFARIPIERAMKLIVERQGRSAPDGRGPSAETRPPGGGS